MYRKMVKGTDFVTIMYFGYIEYYLLNYNTYE